MASLSDRSTAASWQQFDEERFHALVDAITDYAVFLLDKDGNVATWNPGAERTKGYRADEIIGRHFSVFYTDEDRANGKPWRILDAVRQHGRFEDESWRVRKDGSRFWANVVITALRDEAGQIAGFAKVTRDLTERRAAEELRLKLEEERVARLASESERTRLLSLLQQVPAIVNFLRGPELVFELVHPLAVKVIGDREVHGKSIRDAVPEMLEQPFFEHLQRVYQTGEPFKQIEAPAWHLIAGRKVETYWNSAYLPVRDAAGAVEGVMTFDVDVTETVRARQRLEANNRVLHALTELALALSNTRTVEDVAQVLVDQGILVAQADTCALYTLTEGGKVLELAGQRGIAPELLDRVRRLTEADSPAIFATLRARSFFAAETAQKYIEERPALAKDPANRVRAFWRVPLYAEGEALGVLGMGFHEERTFSPDDRSLVETLANQCAQALLRALRLEREERTRAWLDTTLRSIGDAVITTDLDNRVTLMNEVAERLTGWSEEEALGRPLDDVFAIFSAETRGPADNPVARVLREGIVVGLANHTVLRSRAGSEVPIDDSAAPIRDRDGELFGVVLVFRDVTLEKRNEVQRAFLVRAGATLLSSFDWQATLADVARLAVPQLADWCTIDIAEGTGLRQIAVAHTDPEKVRLAEELAARYPDDPNAPTGPPQVMRTGTSELYAEVAPAMLDAAARDDDHRRILRELQLQSAMLVPLKGRDRTFGVITFVFAGSGRKYDQEYLAFAEEFARRAALAVENALAYKHAEEARAEEQRLREEADIANRAKDEFLALVSHELRTPLNAIIGWAKILGQRELEPTVAKAVAVIDRNAQAQVKIIEDILDISRIVTGKLRLELKPLDLVTVARQALEVVRPSADAKQISLEFRPDADAHFLIADSERLQQVIWNLLSNAVKFTDRGGAIRVAITLRDSTLDLEVADTGHGIPAAFLPHIFEAFRQADASAARRFGGLGLGLALVRRIVELHGGTVRAVSPGVGKGSTFTISLPVHAVIRPDPRDQAVDRRTPTAPVTPQAIRGLRILVVDDDPDARDVLSTVLAEAGAVVETAASAQEGFEAIRRFHPQLLLSDIGMPNEDGLSFIRRVRALPRADGGAIPAIALTAYTRQDDRTRALAAGFTTHVGKPVNPNDLIGAVAHLALYVQH